MDISIFFKWGLNLFGRLQNIEDYNRVCFKLKELPKVLRIFFVFLILPIFIPLIFLPLLLKVYCCRLFGILFFHNEEAFDIVNEGEGDDNWSGKVLDIVKRIKVNQKQQNDELVKKLKEQNLMLEDKLKQRMDKLDDKLDELLKR